MAAVAAVIHLGGSSATWAFSTRQDFDKDPRKVLQKIWFGQCLVTTKAPFCLLVRQDGKTLAEFGYEAEEGYAELVEKEEHTANYYFSSIAWKQLMMEYNQAKKKGTDISLNDEKGKSLSALTVLTLAIDFLKQDLEDTVLTDCVGIDLGTDMHVVLTVPGYLQNTGALELVRKAALKVGISPELLSIITDLDAASVLYQYISPHEAKRERAKRYLVVKAARDSTEAVVHEVEQNDEIKEISTMRSYEYGGKLVDKAIENFFIEVVGKTVWDSFKSTLPEDYLDLTRYLELTKRNYQAAKANVKLKVPVSLFDLYSQTSKKTLREAINVSRFSRDIAIVGDKMKISSNIFMSFFDEATEKIISIIKRSLRHSDVETVVMFGGFADLCILQQAVRSAFPNISIVFIEDALKGAVIAGHTQKCVKKLKMEMAPKALMVAAIDFGTTYSGWAFSFSSDFESDRTKASVGLWNSGSAETAKTPTCILIRPGGKTVEAFGYDAENRYSDLIEKGEHSNYYYFQRFKMLLKRKLGEKINREITLEDEMGRSLPALDVFALSIKFLKEDVITIANNRLAGIIQKQDIHWVLTVPAIWTDGAKQFMREAAFKAGIESKRLTIALEPEVASIYCRHLSMETTVGNKGVSTFKPGTRYMILDAGGGTIDITVHEVDIDDGVKEVHSACGGGWGGTMVDKEFENVLIALLGKKIYLKFKREDMEEWLELWRAFEVKKRSVSLNNTSPIRMKLPLSLIEMFKEDTGRSLEDAISNNSKYSRDIKFSSDKIQFSDKLSRSFFQGSVDTTVRLVKSILEDKQVTAILMVGGYSDSPMLQQAIKSTFPDIQVVVPLEACYSIMKGALIFGHLPKFITERVLKYTYGIDANITFVEGKHPESKRLHTDTGDKCSNMFSKHVEKNQSVKVGEPQVLKSYSPLYKQQKQLRFSVYASELLNPEYLELSCHLVGEILVDLSDDGDLDREVLVALTFSDTEIVVEATEKKTGKETQSAIDFLG